MTTQHLTRAQALQLVSQEFEKMTIPCFVIDAATLEKPYGWVFHYNSKAFVETGARVHKLAGNGPIIVNKFNGTVHFMGTNPAKDWIADYE